MKHFTLIFFFVLFSSESILMAQTGEALHFDGTDDYISAGDVDATDFGTNDFTIEFWLNTNSNFGGNIADIMSKRPVCGCANFWNIKLRDTGILFFESSEAGCANLKEINANTSINDGQWHHIAITRVGTTVSLYIDGTLDIVNNAFSLANLSNTAALEFGRGACNAFPGAAFYQGKMDEIKIWNYALSATDIQENYDKECTGNEAGLILFFNLNQGIANGNNPTEMTAMDASPNGNNGTLNSFELDGNTSNWVEPGAPVLPPPSTIPTLSEWGLIVLALLLLISGTLQLLKKGRVERIGMKQ